MYTEGLEAKVKKLERADLEKLAVMAIFHLRCVSGSRNSFSADTILKMEKEGISLVRDASIEVMHHRAAEFLHREDV